MPIRWQPKPAMILAKILPILPCANHGHGLPGKVEAHQPIKKEVSLSRTVVGARDPAVERKQQTLTANSATALGSIVYANDLDAKAHRRLRVDVVVPGGPGRDEPSASFRETP